MTVGVDYSFSRPGGAALRAAGIGFVARYLAYRDAPQGARGKFLTDAEVADLRTAGLAIVANFESTATRALSGKDAGVMDAQDALAAMEGLGFPASCACYFSVDFDAQAHDMATIDAYLAGAASILGLARVGVYGSYAVIEHCVGRSATFGWQTLAWSSGKVSAKAHLYQYQTGSTGAKPINGAAVDYDRSLKDAFGAWLPPGLPDTATQEDTTVALTFSVVGPFGTARVTTAGHQLFRLDDPATRRTLTVGESHPAIGIYLAAPLDAHAGDRQSAVLFVGDKTLPAEAALLSDVTFTAQPDDTAALAAAVARINAAKAALG